jgi:AraC-like DNA-binding protein
VDAAAGDHFDPVHNETVGEALRTLRVRSVSAILLSPQCLEATDVPSVARMLHEFPGIPAVALLSRHDAMASERLLQLGASGVRSMIDLTKHGGWQRLREMIGGDGSATGARILGNVLPTLAHTTPGVRRFFELLVWLSPITPTVRSLTGRLRICASTFMSRFFRSELPSPKRYLASVRLLHASALFEIPGLTISDVAHRLEYSSPQSFGRHVRAVVGMTAGEFRERLAFDTAMDDFTNRMILPYRATFRTFDPF